MGAMAQSFQGLGSPGPASQKIGQLGSIAQGLGAGGAGMLGPRGNQGGVPGFKTTRPRTGQLAGQLASRAKQQADTLAAAQQPGAPQGLPVGPGLGPQTGGGAPPSPPGGGVTGGVFAQGPLTQANLQPLPGAQPPLTPSGAIGGAGGIGMGRRFPQQLLGHGGWGSQGDASGLPPGTVF